MKKRDEQIASEFNKEIDAMIEQQKEVNMKFASVFPDYEQPSPVEKEPGTTTTQHLIVNNQSHGKMYPYQYQHGTTLSLCIAVDKKEAMKLFGTHEPNRVNRYMVDQFFVVNVFQPHEIVQSVYDPSRFILRFPIS